MPKSIELQNQINELDLLIQQGAADAQLNLWEMQRKELNDQLQAALQEEAQQETTTERIGYILDNITVEGLTIAEIITNDDEYKLVRKGVQASFEIQAWSYEDQIKTLSDTIQNVNERSRRAEQINEQLRTDNKNLESTNYQLTLDNEELDGKVRKVAELQYASDQQIEQQKQHIADLQNQIAIGVRGALNVVDMPQDTSKMAAEIIARKVRITNVRFMDENGIDLRKKTAEVVLTGEIVEYEAIYEKRYIILNAEQAEQYRADEANKKAEIEAQNAVIPTIEQEIEPVNAVTEVEETATEQPFPDQVQTADSQGDSADVRNEAVDESLEQNAEENGKMTDDELEREDQLLHPDEYLVTMKLFNALAARVSRIEAHANIQAVA